VAASSPLWLIYALGGGWGHLTRAAALARAATPHCRVRILTNSPHAPALLGRFDIIALDPALTVDAAREQVPRHIASAGADCLIVDTFPRGFGGELLDPLHSFSGTKVFVARDLNPQYADAVAVEALTRSSYHLVLNPGDMGAGHVTAPWLVRSQNELLPRDRARALLRLSGDRPCVVVCAAGNRDELKWYGAAVSHLLAHDSCIDVRLIAAVGPPGCPGECWLSYWPAVDLYNAAGVVVGGAGYNTVYECLACGVPLRRVRGLAIRSPVAARAACGGGCFSDDRRGVGGRSKGGAASGFWCVAGGAVAGVSEWCSGSGQFDCGDVPRAPAWCLTLTTGRWQP